MATESETIRVIVFQDNGMWVAQCLEHDIGAQAKDIDTLTARLEVVLRTEFKASMEKYGKPFAGIDPAPERFHLMWEHRTRSVDLNPAPWISRHENAPQLNYALVA
jgi:hypothetical protein